MKTRWAWIAVAAVIVLVGGGLYYARTRAQAPPQGLDPALELVIGIRMLERDPVARLTDEQVTTILPFLKALKDIPVSNVEQVRAMVRTISDTLTPSQRGAIEEMRRRIQAGRRPGGPGAGDRGAGPGGGFGGAQNPGFDPQQARARAFEATIRMLEQRIR